MKNGINPTIANFIFFFGAWEGGRRLLSQMWAGEGWSKLDLKFMVRDGVVSQSTNQKNSPAPYLAWLGGSFMLYIKARLLSKILLKT